jgi:polysaccharide export outer membrane protein
MAAPKLGKVLEYDMGIQFKKLLLAGALFFALAIAAAAQTPVKAPYRLQQEDIVSIAVFNQQQILAQVPVGRDGTITAPFIGTVPAEGKTIDELIAELAKLYQQKLRLRDPIVSVTLLTLRQYKATIGGAVQHPGSFPIRPGDTILTLYTNGGGEIPDQADLRRGYLRHAGSTELIPVDLYSMSVLGDMSQNFEIKDGDELTVPEQRNNRVIITGAVQSPGIYPYHEPMTLADLIALGHGEIRYRSRFSKTIIIRQKSGLPGEYVTIHDDFVKFVRGGDSTQNAVLQPGDFVFVPESDTPDFNQVQALFNVAYIINLIGGGNVFNHIFGF